MRFTRAGGWVTMKGAPARAGGAEGEMAERIVRTERRDPAAVDRSTLTDGARRIL